MKRNSFRLSKMKYYSITLSTILGIFLSAVLIMIFGYAGLRIDLPPLIISIMLSVSLASGGFLSGYIYGRHKRRKGMICGIICGAVMYAVLLIFGIFYLGKLPPIRLVRYMLTLCTAGAAGGITGVNSKIRRPPI